jgi:GTP-binding protein
MSLPRAKPASRARAAPAPSKAATTAAGSPPKVRPSADAPSPFDVIEAEFTAARAEVATPLPEIGLEVAFAGRSNVGKSTLLNAMVKRKGLVRTSSRPGSTRQINLFRVRTRDGLELGLVDLPGYGYAQRGRGEVTAWGTLIEDYLATRLALRVLVLLVDARRGLEDEERELLAHLAGLARPTPVEAVVVATKLDKVPNSQQRAVVQRLVRESGLRVLGVSGETGDGVLEVWRALRRVVMPPA